jgi:hypothetical protein
MRCLISRLIIHFVMLIVPFRFPMHQCDAIDNRSILHSFCCFLNVNFHKYTFFYLLKTNLFFYRTKKGIDFLQSTPIKNKMKLSNFSQINTSKIWFYIISSTWFLYLVINNNNSSSVYLTVSRDFFNNFSAVFFLNNLFKFNPN